MQVHLSDQGLAVTGLFPISLLLAIKQLQHAGFATLSALYILKVVDWLLLASPLY